MSLSHVRVDLWEAGEAGPAPVPLAEAMVVSGGSERTLWQDQEWKRTTFTAIFGLGGGSGTRRVFPIEVTHRRGTPALQKDSWLVSGVIG